MSEGHSTKGEITYGSGYETGIQKPGQKSDERPLYIQLITGHGAT